MGHYASEMDPEWEAKSKHADRIGALRKSLEPMPMSAFTVKEYVAAMKVLGLVDNGITVSEPTNAELDALEAKVGQYGKKGPSLVDFG